MFLQYILPQQLRLSGTIKIAGRNVRGLIEVMQRVLVLSRSLAASAADVTIMVSCNTTLCTGPMDVQVFGDVAVAQGGVTEKRIRDGKDDSGEGVWTDIFEKCAGKWVVVRSLSESVK